MEPSWIQKAKKAGENATDATKSEADKEAKKAERAAKKAEKEAKKATEEPKSEAEKAAKKAEKAERKAKKDAEKAQNDAKDGVDEVKKAGKKAKENHADRASEKGKAMGNPGNVKDIENKTASSVKSAGEKAEVEKVKNERKFKNAPAPLKKDGTPDMRYKANKEKYGN